MTELERELQATVRLQEEIFTEEMKKLSDSCMQQLRGLAEEWQAIAEQQKQVIEKQKQTIDLQRATLGRYSKISEELSVSLDERSDEQLRLLQKKLGDLELRLSRL